MVRKNKKTLYHRRKREGKTNYKKRLALLKSGRLRLVIRKFNKNIITQVIEFHPEGDKVIASSHSNELKRHGWKFNKGNIPAAYLVGLIIGKKAKGKEAVLDLGLQSPVKGGRLYAALKGAVEGGLKVKSDEKVFPKEGRIEGKHIAEKSKDIEKAVKEIKEKILKD